MKKIIIISILFVFSAKGIAQNNGYWQQKVDYKMNVSLDVKTNQYSGNQELVYTNNSNDTLKRVFYHLYPNAFQPGSEMDARLRSIKDPDRRMTTKIKLEDREVVESRIRGLSSTEIGYLKISNFAQDGNTIETKTIGTVLEVPLNTPLLPNQKTTLTLDFEGQVPIQIRRSGRNNNEGVAFSMTQWYPKMAEFDFEGWHAEPYIAREFHGVWGNFEVNITINKNYTIGGTGYLQNPNEIGHGYAEKDADIKIPNTETLTWKFKAPNVHDFAFAADNNFVHDTLSVRDGPMLHFFYKNNPNIIGNWKRAQPKTAEIMQFFSDTIGKYPYKQYSIIQGGDGGMEYAMCTLILGQGSYDGLVGVITHEMGHSWFQHILASNESKNYWMDEGFTSYIEDFCNNAIIAKNKVDNPFEGAYNGYYELVKSGKEQPLTTHADRFDENRSYSIAAYSKGEIFLTQLGYLIGKENLAKTLKRFYEDFKFMHPTPNDIKRTAERVSGAELDWYLTDWTKTTNTIDYGIKDVRADNDKTYITIERIGRTPMPLDITVSYNDGTSESFYVPLRMMHFVKENEVLNQNRTVLPDWAWANQIYEFTLNRLKGSIRSIVIDPSNMMADIFKENNVYRF